MKIVFGPPQAIPTNRAHAQNEKNMQPRTKLLTGHERDQMDRAMGIKTHNGVKNGTQADGTFLMSHTAVDDDYLTPEGRMRRYMPGGPSGTSANEENGTNRTRQYAPPSPSHDKPDPEPKRSAAGVPLLSGREREAMDRGMGIRSHEQLGAQRDGTFRLSCAYGVTAGAAK